MSKYLFIGIILTSIWSCDKSDNEYIAPTRYELTNHPYKGTATVNDTIPLIIDYGSYSKTNSTRPHYVELITYYDSIGIFASHITVQLLSDSLGKHFIIADTSEYRTNDTIPSVTMYIIKGSDVLTNVYRLAEDTLLVNYFEITNYLEDSAVVEGNFQLHFILDDFFPQDGSPLPDTAYFTNGRFRAERR